MPSSYYRPSPATGYQAQASSPGLSHGSKKQPRPLANLSASTQDTKEALVDDVKNAYTELNKVTSERDRYFHLYEQANRKLSEYQKTQDNLKKQVNDLKEEALTSRSFRDTSRSLKEENALLKRKLQESKQENKELASDVDAWMRAHAAEQKKYNDSIAARAASASPSGVPVMTLPERPKSSRKSKDDKDGRQNKAEKERLSRRFVEKRPPTRSRRQSLVDPWSPGVRPAPSAAGLDYADGPAPAVQPSHSNIAFSTALRTANPLGSSLYHPGGGGLYDNRLEDGNYHAYPVAR